jgi:hypothetical protein
MKRVRIRKSRALPSRVSVEATAKVAKLMMCGRRFLLKELWARAQRYDKSLTWPELAANVRAMVASGVIISEDNNNSMLQDYRLTEEVAKRVREIVKNAEVTLEPKKKPVATPGLAPYAGDPFHWRGSRGPRKR